MHQPLVSNLLYILSFATQRQSRIECQTLSTRRASSFASLLPVIIRHRSSKRTQRQQLSSIIRPMSSSSSSSPLPSTNNSNDLQQQQQQQQQKLNKSTGDDDIISHKTNSVLDSRRRHSKKETTSKNKTPQSTKTTTTTTTTTNSYLKINLDVDTMTRLHHAALAIRDASLKFQIHEDDDEYRVDSVGSGSPPSSVPYRDDDDDGGGGGSVVHDRIVAENDKKTNKKKKRVSFRPRSLQSLHMTFFFGGEHISALSPDELQRWHSKLSSLLPLTTSSSISSSSSSSSSSTTLQFRELALFPPRRRNLIVALFDAPDYLHKLHADVVRLSSDDDDEEMSSGGVSLKRAVIKNPARWTPHVTIGNIIYNNGGKRTKRDDWGEVMENVLLSAGRGELLYRRRTNGDDDAAGMDDDESRDALLRDCDDLSFFEAVPESLSMGGVVPTQMELDWNLPLWVK